MPARVKKSIIAGAITTVLGAVGFVVLGYPEVRAWLAPLHDGVFLPLWGEWVTRRSPVSQLILTTALVVGFSLWIAWLLGVDSLEGLWERLLAFVVRVDRRSRFLRQALVLRGRIAQNATQYATVRRFLRRRPKPAAGRSARPARPGRLSRSYFQALQAEIDDEERRYHATADEKLRASLIERWEGAAGLFLVPGGTIDTWALRQAVMALEEAAALGAPGHARLDAALRKGLQAFVAGKSAGEDGRFPLTAVLKAIDGSPRGVDLTFLYLSLLHQLRRGGGAALATAIRARIEGHASRLVTLARSLAAAARLSPIETRHRRRELSRLGSGSLPTLNLFALAPAYVRLLLQQGDAPLVRAWVGVLEEIAALAPVLRGLPEAEPLLGHMLADGFDGTARSWRAPPSLRAALLRAEEMDGDDVVRREEARFALVCP